MTLKVCPPNPFKTNLSLFIAQGLVHEELISPDKATAEGEFFSELIQRRFLTGIGKEVASELRGSGYLPDANTHEATAAALIDAIIERRIKG